MRFGTAVFLGVRTYRARGFWAFVGVVRDAAKQFVRRAGFPGSASKLPAGLTPDQYRSFFWSTRERSATYRPLTEREPVRPDVRAIAFYLPQFHPIPENDQWWGRGFTEWTNVTTSVPQYIGHHQPRLPGELGLYDLRVPQIQERQADLAKRYGIAAFCFYYYWFGGKRVLLDPLNTFAGNSNINLPFAICWANENWTRRWDGRNDDVLLQQEHSESDDQELARSLLSFLQNDRYLRIHGKPLILVYAPHLLPSPKRTARIWRAEFRKRGIGEVYLAAVQSHDRRLAPDPRDIGFDAAVEFPPAVGAEEIREHPTFINPGFEGRLYDYRALVDASESLRAPPYKLFRGVMPDWDNSARRPSSGFSFVGGTPVIYQRWLENVVRFTKSTFEGDERLVFINAWNEWAEGAYLEPDRHNGYAYLEATYAALGGYERYAAERKAVDRPKRVAVVLHLYHDQLWREFSQYLKRIPEPIDVFVTVPDKNDHSRLAQEIREDFPTAQLIRRPNRGRDIGPFLWILQHVDLRAYEAVLKIHSKRTNRLAHRRPSGDDWRRDLLEKLLPPPPECRNLLEGLRTDPKLGLVGPAGHMVQADYYWENNVRLIWETCDRLGISRMPSTSRFAAGSMFWFRPAAFSRLRGNELSLNDFEPEAGQVDQTRAHALERLFAWIALEGGFHAAQTEFGRLSRPGPYLATYYPPP